MASGFGQFAGSFANSFTRTRDSIAENERRDELAKLQAKLVEMQLKGLETKIDANTTLADILTGNFVGEVEQVGEVTPAQGDRQAVPDFSVGGAPTDLLSLLSGESDLPPGIQAEGQLAALQSGTVSGGDLLDFQTQQNMLAARPNLSALFGQDTDANGNPRMIPTGIAIDHLGRPSQQFGLNPEFNTTQQNDITRMSFEQITDSALEAIDIEAGQRGTFLESGSTFGDVARDVQANLATAGGAFGFDTKEQEAAAANRDRLDKLYGIILNTRLQRLMETDESLSIVQIQQQMEISPSTDKRPEANALLLADFLQEELNRADIEGTSIPAAERKRAIDFIRKARSGEHFGETEPIADVPGAFGRFKDFTLEQINDIDLSSITSSEEMEAYKARLAALRQQGSEVAQSALEKAKAGLATAQDFARMTIADIRQIDQATIEQWTEQQKAAFNKRREELGL